MERITTRSTLPAGSRAALFVSVPVGVGGSTRSMANVLGYLGGDVTRVLVAPTDGRFVNLVADLDGAELHLPIISSRWPRPPRRALSAVKLAVFVRRNRDRIAVIHANGLKEMSLGLLAALVGRMPMVVWVHNFKLPPSVVRFGWLWRRLLNRLDVRFAAVSPLARDLVADAGLVDGDDVAIVPNPIDPADVLVTPDHRDERAPDEPLSVAFLGSPAEYKGFQFLPELIDLTTELAPVRWLIFSHQTDQHLAATWDRLRQMTSTHTVSIEGKFTDVRTAYARCDIVVCPSLLESFCRVAAEAMLNGIPVVGSDLDPICALLGNDEAGIVFPQGDVEQAAKAVVRLAHDPDLRAQLGAAGKHRAEAFAPVSVAAQLRQTYALSPS